MEPTNWIDKLSSLTILPDIYKDLAKPGVRKTGKAIGDALEFVFLPSRLMKHGADWVNILLEKHLDKVRQKIDEIPEENVMTAPVEISVPILQKLAYTTNEDLANLFINLLANASNTEHVDQAHPNFVSIIERLSADEARILAFISGNKKYIIHYVTVAINQEIEKTQIMHEKYLTDIVYIFAEYPKNMSFYLSNMVALGLLYDDGGNQLLDSGPYRKITEWHKSRIDEVKSKITPYKSLALKYSYLELTLIGRQFIEVIFK